MRLCSVSRSARRDRTQQRLKRRGINVIRAHQVVHNRLGHDLLYRQFTVGPVGA